ncbi:MAG: hypothetical protein O7G85_07395 [Planctomycetota bacterium]|nr:hypothetical protein [Planctomycetota bacterium]
MSDIVEHNPNDHEDPLAGPTWLISILGAVLLIVTVLGLIALYNTVWDAEEDLKIVEADAQEVQDMMKAQHLRLEIPHQVRYEEEVATVLPIEDAMRLIAEEY